MGQTRLSALVLLHIKNDANINNDNVIYIVSKKKERALEFVNICDINSDTISLHEIKRSFFRGI